VNDQPGKQKAAERQLLAGFANGFRSTPSNLQVVPRQVSGDDKMKHQRHFEYGNRSREELQTRSLIADIDRIVQIIDSDIVAEEENASVFDNSQAEYPMLARTLAARRDNLKGTIAALEKRLSDMPVELDLAKKNAAGRGSLPAIFLCLVQRAPLKVHDVEQVAVLPRSHLMQALMH
jgi:hypothetical protein